MSFGCGVVSKDVAKDCGKKVPNVQMRFSCMSSGLPSESAAERSREGALGQLSRPIDHRADEGSQLAAGDTSNSAPLFPLFPSSPAQPLLVQCFWANVWYDLRCRAALIAAGATIAALRGTFC